MTMRIGITGIGVLSALGDDPQEIHRALCAGERGLLPVPHPQGNGHGALPAAPLVGFEAERYLGIETNLRPLDGTGRRLASAVALALESSGWTEADRAREPVGLVAGTMFAGMKTIAEFDRRALEAGPQYVMPLDFANTVFNAAAGQTAIRHHLTGPNATLGGGPVAGLQALGYAMNLLRSGQARAILAGGVDELSREALTAFSRAGMLSGSSPEGVPAPFDRDRDGFALGEGAVFFMLEPLEDACRRGAPVLAEVVGSVSGWAPAGDAGEAGGEEQVKVLARTIAESLAQAGAKASELDAWSASASGSRERDRDEALGFAAAVGERASGVAVAAVKGAVGEALGAGGGLQVLALLGAMRSGRLPGVPGLGTSDPDLAISGISLSAGDRAVDLRLGLATAVGFDGAVEALVLRRWEG